MPKKNADDFEYLSNNPDYVPNPEIEEFMELEISRAPKDPELLAHRLRNNTAASPRDAGGDLDAAWEDVNDSGSETVAGFAPKSTASGLPCSSTIRCTCSRMTGISGYHSRPNARCTANRWCSFRSSLREPGWTARSSQPGG